MVYCVAGIKNYSDKEFSERRHEFYQLEPIAQGSYYDETKAVTETNIYDEFDVLQTTFSYQYDDSGLVTVYSMYDGLGMLIDQEFYLYNASGLLQQSIDIDGNITDYGYSNGVLSS
ncbi:MAG: hypothetical protein WC479_10390, partial [Candidatus Izemoplasmatales bacterium]